MKSLLLFILILSASFVLAQDNQGPDNPRGHENGNITVTGCVSRSGGDYVLTRQHQTYELQGTGKVHVRDYVGQEVEVSGKRSGSLSNSSDATSPMGSASPVTINVTSIKTLNKECSTR